MVKTTFSTFLNLVLLILAVAVSAVAIMFAFLDFYRAAYPMGYKELVYEQSRNTGVEPELIFAVIRTESGFRPTVESSVAARGLMQIRQATFEWTQYRLGEEAGLHFDDLYDSEINVRYGAELLRLLFDEFGTETNALCAYHAGWGSAKKWLADPNYSEDGEIVNIPFGDTKRYVEKVILTKEIYKRIYND